jgi:hypothetical protein
MEDKSAVVTLANTENSYAKKCKYFFMVLNYIKEQISLGQIEACKIYGKLNNADLHTKPLRSSAFRTMAHKILGQPPRIEAHLPLPNHRQKTYRILIWIHQAIESEHPESPTNLPAPSVVERTSCGSTGTDSGGRQTYTGHDVSYIRTAMYKKPLR